MGKYGCLSLRQGPRTMSAVMRIHEWADWKSHRIYPTSQAPTLIGRTNMDLYGRLHAGPNGSQYPICGIGRYRTANGAVLKLVGLKLLHLWKRNRMLRILVDSGCHFTLLFSGCCYCVHPLLCIGGRHILLADPCIHNIPCRSDIPIQAV